MTAEYDDTKLQKLFSELEPKRRLQALKGAFRREANRIRKAAVNNLRASGIRTDRDLEKGIRAKVWKRKAGFTVTAATSKKGAGYHTNRQGLKKPILIWAEEGTAERQTRTASKLYRRKKRGHSTGRMKAYCYLKQTRRQLKDTVAENLHNELRNNVIRIAKKYGCR